MLSPYDIDKTDIGFTWVDMVGNVRTWITSRMEKFAPENLQMVAVEIDYDYAKHVKARCGIEAHRLNRITPAVIAQKPVLYITLPGDPETHKLVDGNHRYLKAAMFGWQEIPAYIFDVKQSDQFEVYTPVEMHEYLRGTMDRFSGIA